MPKRMLDDSFLDSPSLEVLSPRAQDALPRFILLADDFGCFEVNPRVLWARGWSRRPDVTEADVEAWIREYAERQALGPDGSRQPPVLMLWTYAGRRYAFLTGWNGPHGQKRRVEYDPTTPTGQKGSKRRTPAPPADILAAVMAGEVRAIDGKPPGTDRETTGNEEMESPSDSTPARETVGNQPGCDRESRVSRSVPAPAVPVAVAVPVADLPPPARAPEAAPVPAQPEPPPPVAALLRQAAVPVDDDLPVRPLVVESYEPLPAFPSRAEAERRTAAESYPRTLQVIDRLEPEWVVGLAKTKPQRVAIERAIEAAGVDAATDRLLAMVRAERAAGREPQPTLGWHFDTITGTQRGRARPSPTPDAWVPAPGPPPDKFHPLFAEDEPA